MSEMRTNTKKGKKLRRIAAAALALVLVLALALGVSLTSSAASKYAEGQFQVELFDNVHKDDDGNLTNQPTVTYRDNGGRAGMDAQATFSKGVTVNFSTDKIFQVKKLNKVKRVILRFDSENSDITLETNHGSQWYWIQEGKWIRNTMTEYIYFSRYDYIDENMMNTLLNGISLTAKNSSSGEVKIKATLIASNDASSTKDSKLLGYDANKGGTSYSTTLTFFDYARADLDTDDVSVSVANKKTEINKENPSSDGTVSVDLKMKVNTVGSGDYIRLGYQVKEANKVWDSSQIGGLDVAANKFERGKKVSTDEIIGGDRWNPIYGTDYVVDSGKHSFKELGDWDQSTNKITNQNAITVTVPNLDPDKEYDIRGVVVTNEDTAMYTETVSIRATYVQPVIATLNIGSTDAQEAGSEKEITAALEFDNHNYDETEDGPLLKAELFYTSNRTSDGMYDTSKWVSVDTETIAPKALDEGGYATTLSYSAKHTLPVDEDAPKASYKLVLTDKRTGYYVTKYADSSFIIDLNPPTAPAISAGSLSADQLISGDAAVGGAAGAVNLTFSGSTDSGSGVKEYSYSMYYLESNKVENFIAQYNNVLKPQLEAAGVEGLTKLSSTSTNAEILTALKQLTANIHGDVIEYTPSTSLATDFDDNDNATAMLSISKDGFYCVKATAVDNVDKVSAESSAIFRVDLTPPNAPTLVMAKQKTKDQIELTGGALDTSVFEPYDNRSYTDSVVWVFIRTDAQAGKSIDVTKYQYSTNGGLTWKNINTAVNMGVNSAYSLQGGTVSYFTDEKCTQTGTFTFDAAFQLSCSEVSGYVNVTVRATDNLENVSSPSAALTMRTNEIIYPTGNMTHEGIEIALAMGNTSLENTEKIEGDLRNLVAQKINEKYYGSSASIITTLKNHTCTWGTDKTKCASGDSCPYVTNAEAYNLYTPSMVNMQGITSANAATDSSFNWVRFDHTNYYSQVDSNGKTVILPTVAFDSNSPLHSTADNNADKTQSTYTYNNRTYYTALTSYVVYTAQTNPTSSISNLASSSYAVQTHRYVTGAYQNSEFTYENTMSGTGTHSWSDASGMGNDTYTKAGRYASNSSVETEKTASVVRGRVYHMVDMTHKTATYVSSDSGAMTGGGYTYYTTDLTKADSYADKMSTIYALGYTYTCAKDWLFLYNGMSTKKEIFFSIDDSQIYAHSTDGYGFFFNTTIRQNTAGQWVISGYMLGICTSSLVSDMDEQANASFNRYIIKLTDIRLDWFANGRMTTNGTKLPDADGTYSTFNTTRTNNYIPEDFFYTIVQGMLSKGYRTNIGGGRLDLIANAADDGLNYNVRNYVLVTEGTKAELYCYVTSSAQSSSTLQSKFKSAIAAGNTLSNSYTSTYRKIQWCSKGTSSTYQNNNPTASSSEKNVNHILYVPRPTVDSYEVGDLSKFEDFEEPTGTPHTDSNCYGFGPISMGRSAGHGCSRDSLVIFSNIVMNVNKARSLSDVITEPKWGTGKVKYVLNISDDSISDLTDPILSSNIIWRIQTDEAKLITWGSLTNKKTTQSFIDEKIEGNGTYVVTRTTGYNDTTVTSHYYNASRTAPGQHTQTKTVAEYIANEYYKSYGVDNAANGNVPGEIDKQLQKQGGVFTLENAQKMEFNIKPEKYATDTANDDFPSGRWYLAYNATGYTGYESYARFSDNLDLKVNEPGRYTVYFAPDTGKLGADRTKPEDDTLDPADAIFDFVVSDSAEAQPIATLQANGTIKIEDYSIDPDDNKLVTDSSVAYEDGVQLTGITKTIWRWELSAPYTDPTTKEQKSVVLMKSGETTCERDPVTHVITDPYSSKTIAQLTQEVGVLADGAQTYINNNSNLAPSGTAGSYYYSAVPTGATITIYEKVVETNTRRVKRSSVQAASEGIQLQSDDDDPIIYVTVTEQESSEKSTNLVNAGTGNNPRPIRPASALTLSKTTMYDTADSSDYITVTRSSFHAQKKGLTLSWQITNNAGTVYNLYEDSDGNWRQGSTTGTVILEVMEKQSYNTSNGRAGGKWKISKSTIQSLSGGSVGGSFALRIIETVTGTTASSKYEDNTTGVVEDTSGRAIYFSKDGSAPTMQTVTLQAGTYTNGRWVYKDYEASSYLDMTKPVETEGAKQIKVTVSGSTDSEGYVKGYGYYFYTTNGSTTTYYRLESDHTLTKTGTDATAAKNALQKLEPEDGSKIDANTEFTFYIDANSMVWDGVEQTPSVSLNVAVFAYDNQSGITTKVSNAPCNMTSGNETKRTKIEKIKLAKYRPMPLEIKSVNTTGETISVIGNTDPYQNSQKTEIVAVNTNVTISFTPKQDWFELTNGSTAYDLPKLVTDTDTLNRLNSNGDTTGRYAKYFTDITKTNADLTNKVTVDYEIKLKKPNESSYTTIDHGKGVNYTSTVTVSESGDYIVTATPCNGSGVYGTTQSLTFHIDRVAPTEPTVNAYNTSDNNAYVVGQWSTGVKVVISGSKDNDTNAYYMYSKDNGANWTKGTQKLNTTEFTIEETGTYTIRIKAVDTAGNASEADSFKVMIDRTAPKVSAPNIKATSVSSTVFSEYLVSIKQTANGVVRAISEYGTENEAVNEMDDEIVFEPDTVGYFLIKPDEGYHVEQIKFGGKAYSVDELKKRTTAEGNEIDGEWVLEISAMEGDADLRVTFAADTETESYMNSARISSYNAVRLLRTVNTELYAEEIEPEVTTHRLTFGHSDMDATTVTSDLGTSIPDGESPVLTVSVEDGYRLLQLEITRYGHDPEIVLATDMSQDELGQYEYTLDAVTGDVFVKVVSEPKEATQVTVQSEGHGTITVTGAEAVTAGSNKYNAYIGDEIDLTIEPDSGYVLSSLKVNGTETLEDEAAYTVYSTKVTVTKDAAVTATFAVQDTSEWNIAQLTVTILPGDDKEIHGRLIPEGETTTDENNGAEIHKIQLKSGDSQTLIFVPDETYQPAQVEFTTGGLGSVSSNPVVEYNEATGYYSVELTELTGTKNEVSVKFVGRKHTITTEAIAQETGKEDTIGGGTITINNDSSSTHEFAEGTNVDVAITPDDGYRIASVTVNGKSVGNRRNINISYLDQDYSIIAKFTKRSFGTSKTTHALTATAVGISDGQDALATDAYSFKLNNEGWSEFQSNTSITYDNLEPNTEYTVTVRAKDRQGNISSNNTVLSAEQGEVNAKKKYTLANVPVALSVTEADDTDNVLDKTVKIEVNPMGNPADTEYSVYISEYANMRVRTRAVVQPGCEDRTDESYLWSKLDSTTNEITVYQLSAGTRYYIQVVARNKDYEQTEVNDQNILSILLSPTAPPDNTLYFEEQAYPGADITLRWDKPAGDVQAFIIYRDGAQIGVVGKDDERVFVDSYENLRADSSYVYSYAYKNSAGVGARRTAVSEEYYNAVKAVSEAATAEDQTKLQEAQANLNALDALKGTSYPNLYKELTTYPVFPAYYIKEQAIPVGLNVWQGQIIAKIVPNSGSASRGEKFEVGLHAYEKNNTTGEYTLVKEGTEYGGGHKWSTEETIKTTKCVSYSGASVTWNDLNINWEYRIFVRSVSSTGAAKYDNSNNLVDGYQSSSNISMEAALQRSYVVDSEGYYYVYSSSDANNCSALIKPEKTLWNETYSSDMYTQNGNATYTDWATGKVSGVTGDGIELLAKQQEDKDSYIKFNKSPVVFVPKNDDGSYDLDYLYGSENTVIDAYDNKYLVVERDGNSTKVKLNVEVYDPDGPADGNLNYTVTGTLGGVTASTTIEAESADKWALGTTEETATSCTLEFEFKNLQTGVYSDLQLKAANGMVDVDGAAIPEGTVNLVVNQSQPTIKASNGGKTKKIEADRTYDNESTLTITADLSASNQTNLRKARVVLMQDQYVAAGLDGLAKRLLSGEELNTSELEQIDGVRPVVTSYFGVSKGVYDSVPQQDRSLTRVTEPVTDTFYYWVEAQYALNNGMCEFLTKTSSGITAHLKDGDSYGQQYTMLAASAFGANESTMNLRFQVMEKPSLTVATEQAWQWVETTSQEYKAYVDKASDNGGSWTLQDVYEEAEANHAINTGCPKLDEVFSSEEIAGQAYRISDDGKKYEVFKLWDTKVSIQTTTVSSSVDVKTGMYTQIEQAKVVMIPEYTDDPSGQDDHAAPPENGDVFGTTAKEVRVGNILYLGQTALTGNVRASFKVTDLKPSTTYYMWVYYQVTDPETGDLVWYHARDYIAVTTDNDYKVATIGFNQISAAWDESDIENSSTKNVALDRYGDVTASGVEVAISTEFYQADQDGNFLRDEETNELIPIEPGTDAYKAAQETFTLVNTTQTVAKGVSQGGVSYTLRNTKAQQGHMIVRLKLTVSKNLDGDGINRITAGAETLDIFILDDESKIVRYKIGFDENEEVTAETDRSSHGGLNSQIVMGTNGEHYHYTFTGLPDPYSSADTSSLTLSIRNAGTEDDGELTGITAELLQKDGKTESTDFSFATQPTVTTLAAPTDVLSSAERSIVKIVPAENLQDGVYEGWLKITADKVKDADVIWIHLYQIVGQVTLKGNIYIGADKPETSTEFIGYSTVEVYPADASTGEDRGEPLYEVETNANGYFEIPNMLTGKQYCIVVKRIGCATFDGLKSRWIWTPATSGEYRLDLQMVAGDVYIETGANAVVRVDGQDRDLMEKYMNTTVAAAEESGDQTLLENVKRCDLDQNGIVNAIDRMLLWRNLNKGDKINNSWVKLYNEQYPVLQSSVG